MKQEINGGSINMPVIKLDLNEEGPSSPMLLKDAIVHVSYMSHLKVKIYFKDGEVDKIEEV